MTCALSRYVLPHDEATLALVDSWLARSAQPCTSTLPLFRPSPDAVPGCDVGGDKATGGARRDVGELCVERA